MSGVELCFLKIQKMKANPIHVCWDLSLTNLSWSESQQGMGTNWGNDVQFVVCFSHEANFEAGSQTAYVHGPANLTERVHHSFKWSLQKAPPPNH